MSKRSGCAKSAPAAAFAAHGNLDVEADKAGVKQPGDGRSDSSDRWLRTEDYRHQERERFSTHSE